MSEDVRIPIVEEQAVIGKRTVAREHVTVRTVPEEEQVLVRDEVRREHVEVTRVPVEREVTDVPAIRTEGDVTIMPVLEERLVVSKKLFLVEELHLRRTATAEAVELPMTLRRTRVEIDRTPAGPEETR